MEVAQAFIGLSLRKEIGFESEAARYAPLDLSLCLCACHVSKMLCERPLALESAVVGVMIGESNSDDTPLSPPLELLLLP